MINGYDFPEISYFTQGNVFTGSDGDSFRYRVAVENEALSAYVWHEDLCFECCNVKDKESFEISNDGLVRAIEWIFSQKK